MNPTRNQMKRPSDFFFKSNEFCLLLHTLGSEPLFCWFLAWGDVGERSGLTAQRGELGWRGRAAPPFCITLADAIVPTLLPHMPRTKMAECLRLSKAKVK